MALARAAESGLVQHADVELVCRLPEGCERRPLTYVIPDASCDDPIRESHPRHLPYSGQGIGHEMNDELRERCVELAIRIRQRFGRRALHVDSRMTLARGSDEGLGRVDGSHGPLTETRDQLRRQGAGPQPTSSARPSDASSPRSASCGASCRECTPMKRSYASAGTSKLTGRL